MKRIIVATLSTLVLTTLITPSAKAIRPELLNHPVHPTIVEETAPVVPVEMKVELSKKDITATIQKMNSETVQPQQSEEPPFGYFEKIYREKYGS